MNTKTIVFVHGMFMTPLCWEGWTARYTSRGYHCLAPAWPGRDLPIEKQRADPRAGGLGKLNLAGVVRSMKEAIQALHEKPALIGHSMGGLVVQLLMQQGLGVAGVVIDSAAPQGVFTTTWSYYRANLPAINPFVPNSEPITMSFEQFQYAFVNNLPEAEQRAAYDRYAVPEARGVPKQSLTNVARVDFRKPHQPLLLTAGAKDHIIPPSLSRAIYARYKTSPSLTEFKEFENRDHFVIGERGWEEVADYSLDWLNRNAP